MESTFNVSFDRALIRKALNYFFIHRLGSFTIALLIGMLGLIGVVALYGDWTVYWSVISCVVAVLIGLILIMYLSRIKYSLAALERMANPVVRYTISDNGIKVESDLGSSELKWGLFDEVLKFPGIWLVVYGKSGYLTFRESDIPDGARQLILAKISSASKK